MSKFAEIIFCGALLLIAGCATSPNEPLPANWSANSETAPPQIPPTILPPTIPPLIFTNPPPTVHFNPPPTINQVIPRSAPIFTWTSLNRWAAEEKLPAPQLVTKSPLTTYEINSVRGKMVLAIGSREALWNGLELHLGFAPEFIDDQVFVHGLDLQKNLAPLLCAPTLTFGTNRIVVIDPGHGGINGGTICSFDGHPEKEFTLDWAKRIAPLLSTNGWKVLLTRTSDVYLANSNRVTFATAQHADLFISLHFNSGAPDPKPHGLETFCLTPTGMPSTLTRGYADTWSEQLPDNNFDTQNLQLAVRLQKNLLRASGEEDRGVQRARFIEVLRGQKCPAILIEGGFLSNPHEAKLIETAAFRQKLAEAVAEALE